MNIKELIDEIKNVCIKNGVEELFLFGSYAKGLGRETSDVDIVIDGKYNYFALVDDLDNIMTLKKIDVFEKKNIMGNRFIMEDFNKYAKRVY